MKQNILKKILPMLLCSAIIFSSSLIALADTYPKSPKNEGVYKEYSLGRLKGNNYTGNHTKVSADDHAYNYVADTENCKPKFWLQGVDGKSYKTISAGVIQKKGNCSKLVITNKSYKKKGVQIRLGMENSSLSLSYGFVSGKIDFR